MPTYERVRCTKTLKVKADTWTSIPWDTVYNGKAVKEGDTAVYADGFLSATSVGFRQLTWDFTEDEERGADDWWPGIVFHTQELVEFSIVTVPANPEALIGFTAGAGARGGGPISTAAQRLRA